MTQVKPTSFRDARGPRTTTGSTRATGERALHAFVMLMRLGRQEVVHATCSTAPCSVGQRWWSSKMTTGVNPPVSTNVRMALVPKRKCKSYWIHSISKIKAFNPLSQQWNLKRILRSGWHSETVGQRLWWRTRSWPTLQWTTKENSNCIQWGKRSTVQTTLMLVLSTKGEYSIKLLFYIAPWIK